MINHDQYLGMFVPEETEHRLGVETGNKTIDVGTTETNTIRDNSSADSKSSTVDDFNYKSTTIQSLSSPVEPRSSYNRECIISLHIPKSGGSSLDLRLNKNLLRDKFGYISYLRKSGERPIRPSPSFATGFFNHTIVNEHVTPRFWRQVLPKGLKCYSFTMFRHPVDRVQSAFYYHGHVDEDWSDCLSYPSDSSSEVCYNWPAYQNDMVRQLSGLPRAWSVYETLYATKVRSNDTHYLEAAKQTLLNDIDRVCFLEDGISTCIRSVLEDLGLLMLPSGDNNGNNSTGYFNQAQQHEQDSGLIVNKGYSRPAAHDHHNDSGKDMRLIEAIERANTLDIQLYKFAKETFGSTSHPIN